MYPSTIRRLAETYLNGKDVNFNKTYPRALEQAIQFLEEEHKRLISQASVNAISVDTEHNNPAWGDFNSNLLFRLVHDHHHLELGGLDFTFEGEVLTYQRICYRLAQYSFITETETIQKLFFSEIVLQTATCLRLGKFPRNQKVVIV